MYRHGLILAKAEQIASLLGHEIASVNSALEQLEHEKLMKRSRVSRGVCLFRFLSPKDAVSRACLRQLVSTLESRVGRVMAVKELKLKPTGVTGRNLSLRLEQ